MKPNVALVGHSFVRRFKDSLDRARCSYKNQLNVFDSAGSIYLYGKGGALTDQILSKFEPKSTDILMLDIGTNDLCGSLNGEALASKVLHYVDEYVRCHPNLKLVYIFEIIERCRTRDVSKEHFDFERAIYNRKIDEAASKSPLISFCRHRGLDNIKEWSNDGIHPNTYIGMKQYKMNISNAIKDALYSLKSN